MFMALEKGQTTVTINHGILAESRKMAKTQRRSLSSFVEYCLWREIDRQHRIAKIDKEIDEQDMNQRRRALSKTSRKD